jgi:isopenicillin N synthase-like dioxygenase
MTINASDLIFFACQFVFSSNRFLNFPRFCIKMSNNQENGVTIPVLDLESEEKSFEQQSKKLVENLESVGFVYLKNHGIEHYEKCDQMFRNFFRYSCENLALPARWFFSHLIYFSKFTTRVTKNATHLDYCCAATSE